MAIADLPILSMLRTRMQWHQERQRLLSENVANADTREYRPRDLEPLKLDQPVPSSATGVALVRTNVAHIGAVGGGSTFRPHSRDGFETRPAGNAVVLEDEMMKVANNQMDYQAATTLYARTLGLVKTAIGKR